MLRTTAFLIFATLASSQAAFGQATAGGFNNYGLGTMAGFGTLGGTSGSAGRTTSTGTAGLSAMGATGGQTGTGQTGIGGQSGLGTTMAGGGTFGSFDASFGATQLASGLATAAAVSRATSAMGGGRGGFGGGGFGGRGGFGNQNNNQNQAKTKIRAVLRLGFPVETASAGAASQMVSQRFAKMPLPQNLANVQISLDGRTAVLRGRIDAPEDGKLVERLLSLEPGIDSVRNELVVATAETVTTPVPE